LSDTRITRLTNLLARGRQLHWSNAKKLAAGRLPPIKWPSAPPGLVDLVYRAIQLLIATQFIEQRGYLSGSALDRFGAQLFGSVAGEHLARVHGLVSNYAGSFEDEQRFVQVVCTDLCHAMTGGAEPAHVAALAGTPRAMMKTTHLYCAQVFNDREVIAALS
jgi:hypothetical protein